ncbi:ABC transporter permease [Lactococcus piscium]|uniref:Cell division protein FtsX n=1 Tax=Pseudolactococcus paracarnosus TaxID=2749962 RepID=A0A7L4WFJ9_9LACT|nr:permease-like cell division protein FtsX [Lactococcus paracarnosus]MCJ1993580.1 ABC transporter permease [Lactococcus paracarnosus]QDJ29068.1 cell division protein FtsX [Lactococcus paracarnosus]SPC36012.1 Cell division protein FtsX [Lactococcus piscium]
MIRTFFKHLWQSIKNLRRNGWMTVAAVSSVTITLVLVGVFLAVILNTTKLASDLENNVRISTFLKLGVHDDSKELVDANDQSKKVTNPDYHKIEKAIKAVPNVAKVTYSSKENELEKLTKSLGSTWNMFKGDSNPLYDVYIVEADKPANVTKVSKDIGKIAGVERADYGGANTKKIFGLSKVIRTWGLGAAGLLLFVAIFLISNTIRMTILSRQREIQIMRLVGAKNGYIRWPFFLEGAWVGILGAILPSLIIGFVYRIGYVGLQKSLAQQDLYLLNPNTFVPQLILLMVVVGVVIGSIGSIISMRRFLKV